MKRFLSLALLLGALFGILGQQAALAVGPAWHPIVEQSLPADMEKMGNADCMKTMDEQLGENPCKGLTLDCIASMGCVVPMTLSSDQTASEHVATRHDLSAEAAIRSLAGRMLAPEPEPPAILI